MKNNLNPLKSLKHNNQKQKMLPQKVVKSRHKTEITINKNEKLSIQNTLAPYKPLYLYKDKKTFLLLKRTYYLRELKKTESFVNSEKFSEKQIDLTNGEFTRLVEEFNNLLNMENLYISIEDLFKSLQLQNKIIKILKIFILSKIDEK
jgi:hypothetical protein